MAEQSLQSEERWHPLAAPHDRVAVQIFFCPNIKRDIEGDVFCISYRGKPSELIACGAVPASALHPYSRSTRRVDEDGDACHIGRGSLKRGGRIEFVRYKSQENAARLTGVTAERIRQARSISERRYGTDDERDERNEARYRAEELAVRCLRRMPAKGFPSTDEAMRYLIELRDVLQLAETRRGAQGELVACLADQVSLSQAVRLLEDLPTYGEPIAKPTARDVQHVRLVVDNTRG